MGQAVDQLYSYGIRDYDKDYRNRSCRSLRCKCAFRGHGYQHVNVKCNEFCGKALIALEAFSGIPILEREPPLWPTQLLEFFAERNKEYGLLFLAASMPKNADLSSFTCCA